MELVGLNVIKLEAKARPIATGINSSSDIYAVVVISYLEVWVDRRPSRTESSNSCGRRSSASSQRP